MDTEFPNPLQQLESQLSDQKKKKSNPESDTELNQDAWESVVAGEAEVAAEQAEVQQELAEEQFGSEAAVAEEQFDSQVAFERMEDAIAVKWLEENCSVFRISRNRDSGKYLITGTLDSNEVGYYNSFVVRDQRNRPNGPYYIHAEDTVKSYRKVEINYRGAESLARAVETIILTFAPGDVEIGSDELCDYLKDGRPLVSVSTIEGAVFKTKPKVDVDLSNLIPSV